MVRAMRTGLGFVLIVAASLAGCGRQERPAASPPRAPREGLRPAAASPAARKEASSSCGMQRIVFGLYPSDNPTALVKKFQPLVDYLSQATGLPVELRVAPDYATGVRWIGTGEVDLFRSGINNYLQVNRLHGEGKFPVVAREEQTGGRSFRGAIVVPADSPARSLADLKGKRFAFGDRTSTMGSVIPKAMLLEAGLRLADLGGYEHLSSHDDVALAVLVKDFDAGAVKEGTARKYESRGLRVLTNTPEVPTKPVYASPKVPPACVEALRGALLALRKGDPAHDAIVGSLQEDIVGFVEGSFEEYRPFFKILEVEDAESPPPAVK